MRFDPKISTLILFKYLTSLYKKTSLFDEPCHGWRTYSERLTPMDREKALAWAEQYLTTEEIEAEFAGEIQDA